MANDPSRIDLLELDIDLRLADLWREAVDVSDWSLEIVAAFIRAAYGKGYCDALTEESPGSLCVDHGYRMPDRRMPDHRVARARRSRASRVTPVQGCVTAPGLDFSRGSQCQPSWSQSCAARHRALGRGGARGLSPVHVDRGWREPVFAPSELDGRTEQVRLAGVVVGPVRGDAHAGGLRFKLKDIAEGARTTVVVRYSGSVPDLFKPGRQIVVDGRLRSGTFVAEPGSMITKCPSKYAPKQSGDPA